jgi:hypothetical protein
MWQEMMGRYNPSKLAAKREIRIYGQASGAQFSIEGYGAGSNQGLDYPLGEGGAALHEWVFGTRTFRRMVGEDGRATGVDDDFVARGFENIGASITGRNVFDRSEGRGQTSFGMVGGATIRRTTHLFLCSPTIAAHRSR